eukprot:3398962-Pleurochrysis_carterae.AAC.2
MFAFASRRAGLLEYLPLHYSLAQITGNAIHSILYGGPRIARGMYVGNAHCVHNEVPACSCRR